MKRKLKQVAAVASMLFVASSGFAQIEVNSVGNAAVGTTPIPTARLLVSEGSLKIGNSSTSTERAKNMIKIGDGDYIQIGEWESDNMLSFKANKYNFNNGNVGIGVASPSYKLHIVGDSYMNGNGYVSNNFGIGTTSPSQKLHVVGDSYFNGNIGVGTYPYASAKLLLSNSNYGTNNVNYGVNSSNYNYGNNNLNIGVYASNYSHGYDNVTTYGHYVTNYHTGASGKIYGFYSNQYHTNTDGYSYLFGLHSDISSTGNGGSTYVQNVDLRTSKATGSGSITSINAENISSSNEDVGLNGVWVTNTRSAGSGYMTGIWVTNTRTAGSGSSIWGANISSTSSNTKDMIFGVQSTVSGGDPNWRYSGYFDGGRFVVMNGNVGIGKTPTLGMLDVAGNIYANGSIVTSDERLKSNIKNVTNETEKLYKLQGKSYTKTIAPTFEIINDSIHNSIREKKYETEYFEYGYLAQELKEIFPELVSQDSEGYYGVNYIALIPVIVEALKDQHKTIEKLQTGVKSKEEQKQYDIESLLQRIEILENIITNCCAVNALKSVNTIDILAQQSYGFATQNMSLSDNSATEDLKLYQNAPNPFNERTTIRCYIPEHYKKVQLCVYTMQGVQVQCLNITERANVSIEIEAGALSAGIYSYVLLGDSIASETKQMILTK
ncbi:MAG: tail fiber domain-containing protein [Bacteroidales bacterium]|jgi:hypothetical protein|nr:tail fiber domain-containing protein [Bacteroidales bacterium]